MAAAKIFVVAVPLMVLLGGVVMTLGASSSPQTKSLYDMNIPFKPLNPRQSGPELKVTSFYGKVLLVSNLASQCAFTENSYNQLNELYKRYEARGLRILGVPSNTFKQEIGTDEDIYNFAVRQKGTKFPLLSKTDVNGPDAHPLYKWLKGEYIEDLCDDRDLQCAGWAEAGECEKNPNYMLKNCKKSCTSCSESYPFAGPIKWNFDHFLVSRTGKVIARWDGGVDMLAPQQIALVEQALKQKTAAGEVSRARAPWYIAVPFVVITFLLIAFILRTRTEPVASVSASTPASSTVKPEKKADKASKKNK